MALEKTTRRDPFPYVKPDRSGRTKLKTLEYFDSHPGSHSATEMLSDPVLGAQVARDSGDRALRIRLLRYCRQGLLRRTWKEGEYLYEMTPSGEKRLVHLWEALEYLNPEKATSEPEKKEMDIRFERAEQLLKRNEERVMKNIGLERIEDIDRDYD